MDIPDITYKKNEYIETNSGNKVSKNSVMNGSQNIILQGRTIVLPDCIVRGDFGGVKIGRHCIIGERVVIRPPFKKFQSGVAFFPINIGDYVVIEDDAVINASSIGNYVHIGKGAIVGRRSILKDCCAIAPGSVVPSETTIPPYAYYSGVPALHVSDLPECTRELMMDYAETFFQNFKPV